MTDGNVFSYVKSLITLSDYVGSLPQCRGLRRESPGVYRTNNVILNGDNTSSMKIDDTKGTFTCYSGGKEYGDVISLYRILNGGESIGMFDACLQLADEVGIDIPESILGKKTGPRKTDTMAFADKFASAAHSALVTELGKKGELYEYLSNRHVSAKIIKNWRLGFIPFDSASEMVAEAAAGIPREAVVESGIVTADGFVPMAGRLVFPILSRQGKAISLSSRIVPGVKCHNEDSKYINTRSTHVYDKSATLYGQHLLTGDEKTIVICEGNLDVIALNEVLPDDTTALAVCGSSLTPKHENLIVGAGNAVLMFDGDDAGRAATRKSMWLMDKIHLSVARLPDDADPWDMYISSPDTLASHIAHPAPYLADAITSAAADMDVADFEHWVKHSYSELGYKSSQKSFEKALRDYSDLTSASIARLLDDTGALRKITPVEIGSGDSLSAAAKRAVSAILWLGDSVRTVVFGSVQDMKRPARRRLIETVMPVSSELDVDAIETVIVNFKERIDPGLRAIIEKEYPLSGHSAERDMINLSRNVAARSAAIVSSRPDVIDSMPDGILSLYSTITDISAGAELSTPEETLHASVLAAESIFTETAKD